MDLPKWLELGAEQSVFVHLRLQPRASKNEVIGVDAGATHLRVRVTAPPVDDAANAALVKFLAGFLGIKKSSIRIKSGLRSRNKTIEVNTLTPMLLLGKLKEKVG
jgi:uncharacterized protein (TIGR00251 family)